MLQALGLDRRQVGDVVHITPDVVAFQYRHDLVVRLAAIDHLDTADHAGLENDVGAGNVALREHADIQRVAVGDIGMGAVLGHFFRAVGAGDEAVQGGGAGGGALGPVDHQEAGRLVQFVLDHVIGRHLYINADDVLAFGFVRTGVQPVPGVTAPAVEILIAIHGYALFRGSLWRRALYRLRRAKSRRILAKIAIRVTKKPLCRRCVRQRAAASYTLKRAFSLRGTATFFRVTYCGIPLRYSG